MADEGSESAKELVLTNGDSCVGVMRNIEIIRLDPESDQNESAIDFSVMGSDCPAEYAMLADDEQIADDTPDERGVTPFMLSTMSGKVGDMEKLWHFGADINRKDFLGNAAMHGAVRLNRRAALDWLIDHGANIHTFNHGEQGPLELATAAGDAGSVKRLLLAGASLEKMNVRIVRWGEGIFHPTFQKCIQYLLAGGLNFYSAVKKAEDPR